MKIRNGFVSNSSSCAYICVLCGRDASGWDLCIEDVDMVTSSTQEVFCETELDKFIEDKNLENELQDLTDSDEEWRYEGLDKKVCPFHNLYYIMPKTLLRYALSELNISEDQLRSDFINKFGNLDNFNNYLKDDNENT